MIYVDPGSLIHVVPQILLENTASRVENIAACETHTLATSKAECTACSCSSMYKKEMRFTSSEFFQYPSSGNFPCHFEKEDKQTLRKRTNFFNSKMEIYTMLVVVSTSSRAIDKIICT